MKKKLVGAVGKRVSASRRQPKSVLRKVAFVTDYHDRTKRHRVTRVQVDAIINCKRPLTDFERGRNYYVRAKNGSQLGPKAIIHTLIESAHHGHGATKALMDLGIKVHARSRTRTQHRIFGSYISNGKLVLPRIKSAAGRRRKASRARIR